MIIILIRQLKQKQSSGSNESLTLMTLFIESEKPPAGFMEFHIVTRLVNLYTFQNLREGTFPTESLIR